MARYQRLTLMEREEVSRMLATGHSLRAVAQAIQRAPSTLSRVNKKRGQATFLTPSTDALAS